MQAPAGENPGIANVRVRVGTAYRWSVPAQCTVQLFCSWKDTPSGRVLDGSGVRSGSGAGLRSGVPERGSGPSVSGSAAGSWQVRGGSAASGADP